MVIFLPAGHRTQLANPLKEEHCGCTGASRGLIHFLAARCKTVAGLELKANETPCGAEPFPPGTVLPAASKPLSTIRYDPTRPSEMKRSRGGPTPRSSACPGSSAGFHNPVPDARQLSRRPGAPQNLRGADWYQSRAWGQGHSSQSERLVLVLACWDRTRLLLQLIFTEVSVTHPDLILSLNWLQNNLLVPV